MIIEIYFSEGSKYLSEGSKYLSEGSKYLSEGSKYLSEGSKYCCESGGLRDAVYTTPTDEEPRLVERIGDPKSLDLGGSESGTVASPPQNPVIREWADGLQIGGEDALPEHFRDLIADFEQFREEIHDSCTRVITYLYSKEYFRSKLSNPQEVYFGLRAYHPETNTAEIEVV